MRAINHALTGAIIGLTVSEPLIAIPVALGSHYLLDMIPHFGAGLPGNQELRTAMFRRLLYVDALLCFILVICLAIFSPAHWQLAIVCATIAAAPDALSYERYRSVIRGRKWKENLHSRFARKIQWFERPVGAIIELEWFIAALLVIRFLIR
ncbi:MAG TPA: hypothetical protein VLF79_03820 [Candidatus Saccharimonadales bacterium]|nr:hypothetical protein [Candidatus Saccharimonadales bacterium]